MKNILLCLCMVLFGSCAWAENITLSHDKILMTSQGLFLNIDGILLPGSSVSYVGNGIYAAEYYGQCGRCGWALDKNGKCTNQNCNQYGPRERD